MQTAVCDGVVRSHRGEGMQTDPGTTSRNEAGAAVNLRNPCQYGPRNERAVIALRTTQCQLLSSVCADLWLQGLGPDSDKGKACLKHPTASRPGTPARFHQVLQ